MAETARAEQRPATTTAEDTLKRKSTDANIVSGGHLVAKALKSEGVDTIFTLCGGHIIDIYDGCLDEGIRIVDVRHEQVAAHAADGYARQTGKLGCVVTTAGPGCTNAVTGIATAFRSESPVLHIGGQSALNQWKMGGLQDLPHVDMMRPITKFASTVMSTERIADMVAMAARECFAGAYGPSYLEIPRDVLDREVDVSKAVLPKPGHYRASTRSIGDPADIERLADILVNAERPAILLGQQVWAARGHNEAIALLRGLDIPGYFNGASRGLLPPGDPHHFDRTRSLAFSKADVIVIVGTPFDFRMGYGKRINVPTLVQIDLDYRTVGKNRDITLGIAGDPGAVLDAVLKAAGGRLKNDKRQARQQWMRDLTKAEEAAAEKLMPMFKSEQTPIHPYRVAYEINEFLTDDDLGAGGAAALARPLDGSRRARLARGGHRLCARGQARQSREGGRLLLRRRRLRHDRFRHGDRRPFRRALYRGHRQQFRDEPDPLRPDRQIRRAARQRRQQAGRHEILRVPADVGRPWRGGARGLATRPGAQARARGRRAHGQVCRGQCLGGPQRIRPGDEEPDDVQVTGDRCDFCSPDGAKRNPGAAVQRARPSPHCATLHAGYDQP
jgi:acetolactate synthase-1/2/3 large subunit